MLCSAGLGSGSQHCPGSLCAPGDDISLLHPLLVEWSSSVHLKHSGEEQRVCVCLCDLKKERTRIKFCSWHLDKIKLYLQFILKHFFISAHKVEVAGPNATGWGCVEHCVMLRSAEFFFPLIAYQWFQRGD